MNLISVEEFIKRLITVSGVTTKSRWGEGGGGINSWHPSFFPSLAFFFFHSFSLSSPFPFSLPFPPYLFLFGGPGDYSYSPHQLYKEFFSARAVGELNQIVLLS